MLHLEIFELKNPKNTVLGHKKPKKNFEKNPQVVPCGLKTSRKIGKFVASACTCVLLRYKFLSSKKFTEMFSKL